ncbi:MAG: sugar ABC transporter permease [Clostridia bacterium]|nr:sugar ABC transporter permease [Clostridia bacterium]MBP3360245.1 sugar ABC transporter permease [Clostridia bacterium]
MLAAAWYIVFKYIPLYGITLAFKDFSYADGIFGSDWVGFKYFKTFITNPEFWNMVLNTVKISVLKLCFGFPAGVIFALMLNEITHSASKRVMQTISYLPHFVSWVVIVSIMNKFLSPYGGFINEIRGSFGYEPVFFMGEPGWFYPLVLISQIYKEVGWSSIIYLSAISGVDQELYEAARVDGAGHMRCIWSITIPCILPTIVLQFLLSVGNLMHAGFDQIYLMSNAANSHLSNVLDVYGIEVGIKGGKFSLATAVGLFQSVISFILVISANAISKRVSEISLW